jgi:hypothetical protein
MSNRDFANPTRSRRRFVKFGCPTIAIIPASPIERKLSKHYRASASGLRSCSCGNYDRDSLRVAKSQLFLPRKRVSKWRYMPPTKVLTAWIQRSVRACQGSLLERRGNATCHYTFLAAFVSLFLSEVPCIRRKYFALKENTSPSLSGRQLIPTRSTPTPSSHSSTPLMQ